MESQFNALNPKAWVKFPRGPSSCRKNPEARSEVIQKKSANPLCLESETVALMKTFACEPHGDPLKVILLETETHPPGVFQSLLLGE